MKAPREAQGQHHDAIRIVPIQAEEETRAASPSPTCR
jgi:hypothetical protein